jgi:hypothetical protein
MLTSAVLRQLKVPQSTIRMFGRVGGEDVAQLARFWGIALHGMQIAKCKSPRVPRGDA